MLSRIAESLFWIGRYIERTENMARYADVQYYTSLDIPMPNRRQLVMESILSMYYCEKEYYERYRSLSEKSLFYFTALDENNPKSMLSAVTSARENARSIRESVSLELWENVNKFYHSVKTYSPENFRKQGIHELTKHSIEYCSMLQGFIDNSLPHGLTWSFLKIGIHLERSCQICRMFMTKLEDMEKLREAGMGEVIERLMLRTLLQSNSALDLSRRTYKWMLDMENVLDIMVLHQDFPRSLAFNLLQLRHHLFLLAGTNSPRRGTVEFEAGKISSYCRYLSVEEMQQTHLFDFFYDLLQQIHDIGTMLEQTYFEH
ncbi:alpha-E domain-containing protein [Desulfurispira natronophila]|uniref:Putative alpha-E superfamily protein n=1 Tax=Desulfurispira natronophila TaxID=682562 RepID=A0A7W7Y4X9_9BACT|nr:alpha-E domain-containing protein [Desulfurispira natronophila]MBB5022165.1 putative alpha-E superfamily protein [Desulfurispira natronophila]